MINEILENAKLFSSIYTELTLRNMYGIKIEIELINGYWLINGKKYNECSEYEQEEFNCLIYNNKNPEIIKKTNNN